MSIFLKTLNILLLTFTVAVDCFAQSANSVGNSSEASPGLEKTLNELEGDGLEQLDKVANEFAKDPKFEVRKFDGFTMIKPRTPKSPKIKDPKELENAMNLQSIFNFGGGFGGNKVPKSTYDPYTKDIGDAPIAKTRFVSTFLVEGGVRVPAWRLKRLFLGGGLQINSNEHFYSDDPTYQKHQIISPYAAKGVDRWASAEWDVLILPGNNAASALSAGGYVGKFHINHTDQNDRDFQQVYTQTDKGVQLRWRSVMASVGDSAGIGIHFVTRVSTTGKVTAYVGLNIMVGPRVWIKSRVEK